MIFDLNRYSFSDFRREAKQLMSLALPMMSAQIASVAIGVVDTAMAGAAGKSDLTAVGLGNAVFATVFITFIGIMTALNPTIAQLHGSGEREKVGESGRQGLWFGPILGVLGMILLLALIAPLKNYLDMDDHIEHMFGQYLLFTALGMPAAMLYRSLHAYASSLNKPSAIMWISWAALLLNIPLNYLLIYGKFGFPQLGGAGAGVATAIVFWFNAIALWIYIAKTPYFHTFGLTQTFTLPHWRTQWQLLKLGLPIGFSYFLEASLFTFIVWLIADLGNDYAAAQANRHQPNQRDLHDSASDWHGGNRSHWLFAGQTPFCTRTVYFGRIVERGRGFGGLHPNRLAIWARIFRELVQQRPECDSHCRPNLSVCCDFSNI